MNEVTRYDLTEDVSTGEVDITPVPERMEGRYVTFEDYEALQRQLAATTNSLTNAQEVLKSAGIEADTVQAGVMGLVDKLVEETNWANQNAEYLEALTERMLAAEAKLAALEKQEPVAWCNENDLKLMVNKRMIGGMMTVRYHGERPLFTRPAPAIDLNAVRAEVLENVPTVCDGKEQLAFEAYASSKGLDLSKHPLHYLFLDGKTNQARSAWRECLVYIAAQLRAGNAGKDGSHE